jgi:hypothetical protein
MAWDLDDESFMSVQAVERFIVPRSKQFLSSSLFITISSVKPKMLMELSFSCRIEYCLLLL